MLHALRLSDVDSLFTLTAAAAAAGMRRSLIRERFDRKMLRRPMHAILAYSRPNLKRDRWQPLQLIRPTYVAQLQSHCLLYSLR